MRCRTEKMSIGQLHVYEHNIDFNPPYQREGGLWNKEKQGLFIDSIMNQYDVPKIYFHDLTSRNEQIQYAVIDGKQRLQAIYDFIEGGLKTAEGSKNNKNLFYSDFSDRQKETFKVTTLDIVLVEDAGENNIGEFFLRLNNGTSLSNHA